MTEGCFGGYTVLKEIKMYQKWIQIIDYWTQYIQNNIDSEQDDFILDMWKSFRALRDNVADSFKGDVVN